MTLSRKKFLGVAAAGICLPPQTSPTDDTFARLPRQEDYFTLRGALHNSRRAFQQKKMGRVAFLGGSITNSTPGWRTLVEASLTNRFPDTRFTFINAGIPSLGSVPGAFRLRRDVLDKGPIDLLFVEAAVNDTTNHPDDRILWQRGMEGIIRQARRANPDMDIVMLHFADPDKVAEYHAGKTPEVIAVHDRIAAHYGVPSINLAREVSERIDAGQFTWKDDFKDLHPSPFGHRLYAASIDRLLASAWSAADAVAVPHPLPPSLDPAAFFNARLVEVGAAKTDDKWKLNPSWKPSAEDVAGTRLGFVEVPMLTATEPGAELSFPFAGNAVGIWIVAGPDAGTLQYVIDGGPPRLVDTFTQWSSGLHLPWTLIFASDLPLGSHSLTLRIAEAKNPKSKGTACRIVSFLVNGG